MGMKWDPAAQALGFNRFLRDLIVSIPVSAGNGNPDAWGVGALVVTGIPVALDPSPSQSAARVEPSKRSRGVTPGQSGRSWPNVYPSSGGQS